MYRGDSFQVLVDNPEYVLAIGIALRAKLKAETPNKQNLWDARLSVGVGEISFESSNIAVSYTHLDVYKRQYIFLCHQKH